MDSKYLYLLDINMHIYIWIGLAVIIITVVISLAVWMCTKETYWPATEYAYTYIDNNTRTESDKSPIGTTDLQKGDKINPIFSVTPNQSYRVKMYRRLVGSMAWESLDTIDAGVSSYQDNKPSPVPPPTEKCDPGGSVYTTITNDDNLTCGQLYEKAGENWRSVVCNSPGTNAGDICKPCYQSTCESPKPGGSVPYQFRLSPVTLRSDALVYDWVNNGNIPVRLSWISKENESETKPPNIIVNGKTISWDYDKQFQCGWTDFHCQTVQTTIKPDINNTISVQGLQPWNVYYPGIGKDVNFVSISDPNIADGETSPYSLKNGSDVMFQSLNRHMDDIDVLIFGGDNFYDVDDPKYTQKFFGGKASDGTILDPRMFSKIFITVMGNHDYTQGGTGYNTPSGRQYIQFYGIDGWETPFDNSTEWCSPGVALPKTWTTGCYVVGNIGFITGDNTHYVDSGEANYADVANRFAKLGVNQVFYISHWFVDGMDAVESTSHAWTTLKNKNYFSKFNFNYISGHTHDNREDGVDTGNMLTGGNGFGPSGDCAGINGSCINANCCCPSYYMGRNEKESSKKWKQGWSKDVDAACLQK